VAHYDKACFEIRNLSNDVEDFTLFRVMASSMKTNLSRQAEKLKDKLLEGINQYC
jgi:dynein heavy chain